MKTDYKMLAMQIRSLTEGLPFRTASLANISALLFEALPDINWAGFYFLQDVKGERALVLGPFQGKPACTLIGWGKGVCGAAVREERLQLVPDVHAFPGHIACDSASRSEIVIPIREGGQVTGVLDIDSPQEGRFDREDAEGLSALVRVIEEVLEAARDGR